METKLVINLEVRVELEAGMRPETSVGAVHDYLDQAIAAATEARRGSLAEGMKLTDRPAVTGVGVYQNERVVVQTGSMIPQSEREGKR